VDFDAAVVVNKPQFSKFVHEETHAGPGRADHIRELVDDFFGRGWVDAFLGPEAAKELGMRLDGAEFARVRVFAAPPEPVSIGWLIKNGIAPIECGVGKPCVCRRWIRTARPKHVAVHPSNNQGPLTI
jgi:hypothetical protein